MQDPQATHLVAQQRYVFARSRVRLGSTQQQLPLRSHDVPPHLRCFVALTWRVRAACLSVWAPAQQRSHPLRHRPASASPLRPARPPRHARFSLGCSFLRRRPRAPRRAAPAHGSTGPRLRPLSPWRRRAAPRRHAQTGCRQARRRSAARAGRSLPRPRGSRSPLVPRGFKKRHRRSRSRACLAQAQERRRSLASQPFGAPARSPGLPPPQ